MNPMLRIFALLLLMLAARFASAADYPVPTEGDYTDPRFQIYLGRNIAGVAPSLPDAGKT